MNFLFGRTVIKWNCAGQFHGQIQGAQAGDSVEMRYVAGFHEFSAGLSFVQPGSTSCQGVANTIAVAIAAIPSPRPVSPSPSVVVAESDTGAPTAAHNAA